MSLNHRILIHDLPFASRTNPQAPWEGSGRWPCQWVGCRGSSGHAAGHAAGPPPFVSAYRLLVNLPQEARLWLHVTADERYELYLNGERIGRGPERGEPRHWRFETYELTLEAGEYTLAARTWALGEFAPLAQFSLQPGFLLCAEDAGGDQDFSPLFNTGLAPWQAKKLGGYEFLHPLAQFGCGHKIALDGHHFPWGFERGQGGDWLPVVNLHPGYLAELSSHTLPGEHLLAPALLPPMLDAPRAIGRVRHISEVKLSQTHAILIRAEDHLGAEEPAWTALLQGQAALTLPPHTRRRLILDLDDYYCAYPEVMVSGGEGASLRLHWQESLFDDIASGDKGRRGQVEGKYFTTLWWNQDGIGDRFVFEGGERRLYETLWWEAGRYVEILVETGNQPLTIESLRFRETRYPLENESRFTASDPRLAQVIPLAQRALQMCAHETYMDCPFYEQLMYVGDTRLEALVTYLVSHDDRLPRKALRLFDESRLTSGFTQSRFPSRQRQMIPPFSLWWVGMVFDYLMWRDDLSFVLSLLPGVRAVLDAFTLLRDRAGLVRSPAGWNFIDWAPAWPHGVAPGGEMGGVSGPLNWQYVYALQLASQIETACGEPELAARWRRLAAATAAALIERYWCLEKGLFADDPDHGIFTEHSQCLAVLSGAIPTVQRAAIAQNLFTTPSLTPPTVYFMHYFFETCQALGRMDVFLERMNFWFEMVDYDFKTTYESGNPHNVRSDCHAWGAHPLYHYFASLLGVRPAEPGFRSLSIWPQLASLSYAEGSFPHPAGEITAEFKSDGKMLQGRVILPPGIPCKLHFQGQTISLQSGENFIDLEASS